jgi:hypothetical protein
MGRPGDFSRSTIEEAHERQGERCAWCHEPFSEYDKVEAHHIESVEAGLVQGKTAEEIGVLDNCAIVHANSPFEDGPPCHYEAHGDGQYGQFYADQEMFTLNAADMPALESDTRAADLTGTESVGAEVASGPDAATDVRAEDFASADLAPDTTPAPDAADGLAPSDKTSTDAIGDPFTPADLTPDSVQTLDAPISDPTSTETGSITETDREAANSVESGSTIESTDSSSFGSEAMDHPTQEASGLDSMAAESSEPSFFDAEGTNEALQDAVCFDSVAAEVMGGDWGDAGANAYGGDWGDPYGGDWGDLYGGDWRDPYGGDWGDAGADADGGD